MWIRTLLLILLPLLASADFPLRDVAALEAIRLDSWGFRALEPQAEADADPDWSAAEFAIERANWPTVRIPAIWDQEPGKFKVPVPNQIGWFRHRIDPPSLQPDEEWALCFLGVKYTADVFVNGEYAGVHRGGYTPFLIPLTGNAGDLEQMEILVRVDNRLGRGTVPNAHTGWEAYGGIDREVYLLRRPKTRPENLQVRTFRDEEGVWQLKVKADTIGNPAGPIHLRLRRGEAVIQEKLLDDWKAGIEVTLPLKNPALWSPGEPNLHLLEIRWQSGRIDLPVGVRELRWQEGRLLVNGEPLWLQGFGQHEFSPRGGSILSEEERLRDLRLMREVFGANALRTGHYPHHPDLFALADRLGLLVFTEVPVWQINPQILNQEEVWDTWLRPQIDGMVIRLRNHPSLFAWGVSNESYGANAYIQRAQDHIRELDPDRSITAVLAATSQVELNAQLDFAARNLHYGWYHSRSVYDLPAGVDRNLAAAKGKPLWIAELGGLAEPGKLGGGYSDAVRGTETYQDKMTRYGLQYSLYRAGELAGISIWTWSDYQRGGRPHEHGILGPDRKPKLAAYTTVNLMRPEFRLLALEENAVVPPGGTFRARLAVSSVNPRPGKEVQAVWQIRRGAQVLETHSQNLTLSDALTTEAGMLEWNVAEDQIPALHTLYVELRDRAGLRLHSQLIPFEAGGTTRPGVLRLAPPPGKTPVEVEVDGMRLAAYPHVGMLLPLPPGTFRLRQGEREREFTIEEAAFTDLPWQD